MMSGRTPTAIDTIADDLGWPGQAPSYKIGERHLLQLRDQAPAAEGEAFDLKSFHRRVLDVGSVGLDVLRGAILQTDR